MTQIQAPQVRFGEVTWHGAGLWQDNGFFKVTGAEDLAKYATLLARNPMNRPGDTFQTLEVCTRQGENFWLGVLSDREGLATPDEFTQATQLIQAANIRWKQSEKTLQAGLKNAAVNALKLALQHKYQFQFPDIMAALTTMLKTAQAEQ
jgi:hypothetical protein